MTRLVSVDLPREQGGLKSGSNAKPSYTPSRDAPPVIASPRPWHRKESNSRRRTSARIYDAMQEMVRLGSQATPTTVIDDEIIIGFDLKRISASLRL